MILLSTLGVIRPLFVAADLASELKSDLQVTIDWGTNWLNSMLGKFILFCVYVSHVEMNCCFLNQK